MENLPNEDFLYCISSLSLKADIFSGGKRGQRKLESRSDLVKFRRYTGPFLRGYLKNVMK